MPIHRMEIVSGAGRRRAFSPAMKARIVSETLAPGMTVSEVARRHDLDRSLVYRWRRGFDIRHAGKVGVFLPVAVTEEAVSTEPIRLDGAAAAPDKLSDRIEIDLGRGRCVRVGADVDADALSRVLDVLERR
ncbi:transposase [Aurantimonas aggregata]|uniref:Transposase n=1 Tax=Aurantimonas aggregata TaxID=2047720 RepID=A0A6L9MNS4_9HYPH|nr:transposase [Aurantimonas aggregata]